MTFKFVSPEQAAEREGFRNPNVKRSDADHRRTLREYFGPASGDLSADVTDVTMTNRTIGAHSHEVDEFQILLGQPGALFQGEPVPAMLIHYSDAFAVYGPLTGADVPFHLIQLRAEPIDNATAGAWGDYRLPDDRHLMPYVSERHAGAVVPEISTHESLARGEMTTEMLIPTEEDGLGTLLLMAGADAAFLLPSPKGSSGQFVYVANGSLDYQGERFGVASIGWQQQEDEHVELLAGEAGCRLIVMRLPFPATKVTRLAAAANTA